MRSSVLIVNWRTSALLRRLLESLGQFPPAGEHEVIVVDNASDDFELARFERDFPSVKFLPQTRNLGFARGNNLALEHSTGEHILLLNPDTEVTDGALETLVRFLQSHPKAAIASAQLLFPDGSVQDSCRSFPWPAGIFFTATRLHRVFPRSKVIGSYRMTWFDHLHTRQVDQPMATCWAIPRRVIEDIGFMDEQFPILFNDVDWAWRAKEAGYEIWFVAEARVWHVGGQGTKKGGAAIFRHSHDGLMRFYAKHWKGRCFAPGLWLASAISWTNCMWRTAMAKRG